MNELREDLDRALRTVRFGEAPIERAKRDGRRIRARRRVTLLAGVLAVAAAAAGYPALARNSAAPPAPASGQATRTSPAGHDPVVTAGPGPAAEAPGGLASKDGVVAVGTIGGVLWQVTVDGPNPANPVPADSCYGVTLSSAAIIGDSCMDLPAFLASDFTSNGDPAAFTGASNNATVAVIGEVAPDVTFFIATFTDGQQLKLTPVTAHGHRYIAWIAPLSMTIDSVIAHLGGPYSDSGLTASTAPFELPGHLPLFGLWQRAGQVAPPRDSEVIGSGTAGGRAWKATAYEGPWGTCFVTSPEEFGCVPIGQLRSTGVLGGLGKNPPWPAAFGSAAPGVATVRVTLSNGTDVQVKPVGVGNEDLFAFAIGKDVTPVDWTAYNASGRQVAAGAVASASAAKRASP